MNASDHGRHAGDVGAYLLGVLEPDEHAAFERHLETCAECRRETERLSVAVDALPRTIEEVDPPPELKRSLMAIVAAEARERRGGSTR